MMNLKQKIIKWGQNLKTNINTDNKKKTIIGVVSILLVLTLVISISYALEIFRGISGDNVIKSGKVAMSYTESSNVINITNALPMTDTDGMIQSNYFDFSISSKADTNADDNEGIKIPYDLIIEPKTIDSDKDALTNNQIKLYLTKIENGTETIVLEPTKISELNAAETNFNLYSTENVHKNGNSEVTTKYRLRAWIDYGVDVSEWKDTVKQKQYKFAVNVNGTGEIGEIPEFQTVVPQDNSGANVPVLTNNMIPVYYDESDNNWKKADITKKDATNPWYDYDAKKWANAVTVNDTNRATYLNASAGTPIPMEDINAMFVWIPRYKYTYINQKCSTLTNPSKDTNPECYLAEYIYNDSYHDDLVNELIDNRWAASTDAAEEIITFWKNGEVDEVYTGLSFSDYVNPDNSNTSLEIPAIYKFLKDNVVSSSPQEINIEFENSTKSTGTIKCIDSLGSKNSDNNPISQICTDSTNGGLIKNKSTYTHPAFTFGGEELTGIWVGKFENSATEIPTKSSDSLRTVIIKPDVQSWRYTAVSYFANSIRNMELANNIYGFSQTGSTLNAYTGEISGDSNNLDTHMMKNMEWGAVTYLSHSKYGKNSEVYINNSSDYYTGRSGGNVGGSTQINKVYTDQTSTTQYNTYGFYTYDGYLLKYNTNEKSTTRDLSKVASTTGNIYGIYDMSGSSWEYVMGNEQDSSNTFYPSESRTWSATNKPLDKYYDSYSYGTRDTEYTSGKLGDATGEMGAYHNDTWYNDDAYFPFSLRSWFYRGGSNFDGYSAGLFHFSNFTGYSNLNTTSRVALLISTK